MDSRSKIFKKYTKIDPERSRAVRAEIEKNSYKLVPRYREEYCTRKMGLETCDHCNINPYVIEQVRAKMLKSQRKEINMRRVMETDNFEEIEEEIQMADGGAP